MGIFVVTILSLIAGLLLSITSKVLNNDEENIKEIQEILPEYDCNNCGLGNCINNQKEDL